MDRSYENNWDVEVTFNIAQQAITYKLFDHIISGLQKGVHFFIMLQPLQNRLWDLHTSLSLARMYDILQREETGQHTDNPPT